MFASMVVVSLVVIAIVLICGQRLKKYNVINNLPGPTSYELIKVMSNASRKDIYNYFLHLPRNYGSVVRLWVKPFRPALLITDPKYFQEILTKREFVQRTDAYRLFKPVSGDGLVSNLNVDDWRKDRKWLAPCFNKKSIAQYPLVYEDHITTLVNKIRGKGNTAVDVQDLLHRYAIGVIFELLTNENISNNEEAAKSLMTSLKTFLSVYLERIFSTFKQNDFLFSFCKSYSTYVDSGKHVHDFVKNVVDAQINKRNRNNGSEQENDFLGILLDTGLEYDKLIFHIITFILAGSDTTAQTMAFTLYALAKKPELQRKIYEEYTTLVSTEKDYTPKFEDIQKLKYTERVVKEAMRLYPIVPIIQRKLTTPVSIDGIVIPSDTDVFFSIIGMQTSPDFYDNPQKFDPDRFAPENISKIQPGSYAPFSLGPRDCIGQRIGMVQMKYTISYLIRHFELHPVVPEHKLDVIGDFVLTSSNGIPVIFKERK